MPRLKTGEMMPDYFVQTAFDGKKRLSELTGPGKTALIFLRYYGCTLCQYNIHQYAGHYSDIVKDNGTLLVVLQSVPETIQEQIDRTTLPFQLICDPDGKLYQDLEITPAASKEALLGGNTIEKIALARQSFTHGAYEGEELQLPASFIMDKHLALTYVKYGENGGDVPTPEELALLLQ